MNYQHRIVAPSPPTPAGLLPGPNMRQAALLPGIVLRASQNRIPM